MTARLAMVLIGAIALIFVAIAGIRTCGKSGNPIREPTKEEVQEHRGKENAEKVRKAEQEVARAKEEVQGTEGKLQHARKTGDAKKIAEAEREKSEAEASLHEAESNRDSAEGAGGAFAGLWRKIWGGPNEGGRAVAKELAREAGQIELRTGIPLVDKGTEKIEGWGRDGEPKPNLEGELVFKGKDKDGRDIVMKISSDGAVTPVQSEIRNPIGDIEEHNQKQGWFNSPWEIVLIVFLASAVVFIVFFIFRVILGK